MLLLLLGVHRLSTIKMLEVDFMIINDISVTFIPKVVLKHSRKGESTDKFEYRAYKGNNRLCVLDCLMEYIF